jgi:hypothetical protein
MLAAAQSIMHRNVSYTARLGLAAATALLAAACDIPLGAQPVPDDVVAPSVVGLITSAVTRGDARLVTLATGEELRVPVNATELYGLPGPEKLILIGTGGPAKSDSDTWLAVFSEQGAGCYRLPANGEVRGKWLATSLGFAVLLSDEWDETERRFFNSPEVGFCLNEEGEAWRAYPGR